MKLKCSISFSFYKATDDESLLVSGLVRLGEAWRGGLAGVVAWLAWAWLAWRGFGVALAWLWHGGLAWVAWRGGLVVAWVAHAHSHARLHAQAPALDRECTRLNSRHMPSPGLPSAA